MHAHARLATAVIIGLLTVACGAGQVDDGPFLSPVIYGDAPLSRSVADCMGEEQEVQACVVRRVCAHAFTPDEAMRFHMRPSGDVPWVQVERSPDGEVSGIVFSFQTGMTQNYEDVGGYPCQRLAHQAHEARDARDARDGQLAEQGRAQDAAAATSTDLLTLPANQRRRERAREAFADAEAGTLVFQHALWLARSSAPEDHALLGEALTTTAVVDLLAESVIDRGPRLRHEPPGHRWPLAQILFALRDSEAPSARALLVRLASDPLWLGRPADANDDPVEWLIVALAPLRPPPADVLVFWNRFTRPRTTSLDATAFALVVNGSEPAVELLASLLTDTRSPFEVRRAWLRGYIGTQRGDVRTLRVAEALLTRRLPPRLRQALLADLFSDFSDEIRPDTGVECPDLTQVTVDAAAILRRIGTSALDGPLPRATRETVTEALPLLPAAT